jgi:osmotically-inducible protein OsmY
MKNRTILAAVLSSLISTSALADSYTSNDRWSETAKDAWIDGKAETTLLFNTKLNSFDINTDVNDGVITLTGKVETSIDRELAEELVIGLDGVESVNNELTVMRDLDESDGEGSDYIDAKISTVITSRFLFDSEVDGWDIDVDVTNGKVVLNGTVDSETEKQLAIEIAKNTDDVKSVSSNLTVENS